MALDAGNLWLLLCRRIESEISACNSLYDSRIWDLNAGDTEVKVASTADREDCINVMFEAATGEVICRFGRNTRTPAADATKIRILGLDSVDSILTTVLNALQFPD
jgi:hypothetical protein